MNYIQIDLQIFYFFIDISGSASLILIMRLSLIYNIECTPGAPDLLFIVPKSKVSNPKIKTGAPKILSTHG